ncbi:MAG: hypothetical protein JWM74_6073, partial [Myxococcaceae bacterium]|nr:hypothetical protein [Myxococcaceae bacterium]
AMPITLDLDDEGNHVTLHEPKSVELIPDRGLRVECAANVLWTVLGIQVPITLHKVTAILRPEIVKGEHGDKLVFGLVIEHADFAGVPTMIDDHLTDKINEAVEAEHLDLSWDFSESLSGAFPMPASLRPLDTLSLTVAWGKLRVTEEAFVLAISFHSDISRHETTGPSAHPKLNANPEPEPEPVRSLDARRRAELAIPPRQISRRAEKVVALGAAGLVGAMSLYTAFRLGTRRARREGLDAWLLR